MRWFPCIAYFNGTRATSNGGRYYNKRFKAEAEKRGLKIEYAQYIGYSVTSPTDRFIEVIRENGLCAEPDHCRATGSVRLPPVVGEGTGADGGSLGKKKSSTRKYVCQHCGISVGATEQNTARQDEIMRQLRVEKVYMDKLSRKDTARPEWQEMMKFVRVGDVVVAESISRLARNTKDLLDLIEQLEKKNVQCISQKEVIDTSRAAGKFMLTIFGAAF